MKKGVVCFFLIALMSCSQHTYDRLRSPFSVNENQIHFVVVQLAKVDTSAASRKQLLANFQILQAKIGRWHQQQETRKGLKQHPVHLIRADSITPLLVIRKFEHLKGARSYLEAAIDWNKFSKSIEKIYPISLHNYRQCLVLKETKSYLDYQQSFLQVH